MLKEAHIQYDIIENTQIGNLESKLSKYRVIILPEITRVDEASLAVLKKLSAAGTHLVATNRSFSDNPAALSELFGARSVKTNHDGAGFYLSPENKKIFSRFKEQSLLFWKFNLGLYDFSAADTTLLPIFTPGRPGPPESIGGHERTDFFAVGLKDHGRGKALLIPVNLGRLYYIHGYEQHKNILLDLLDHIAPEVSTVVKTNAHERIEVVVQNFVRNIPENINKTEPEGLIVHLVNLTGFSGNTYFKPLPVYDIEIQVECPGKPGRVWSMTNGPVDFKWEAGNVKLKLARLEEFDGIVIDYE